MMTQYMTPGLSQMLGRAVTPIFWHFYTRSTQSVVPDNPATGTDESTNEWGEPVVVTAEDVSPTDPMVIISANLPCLYMEAGSTVIGPNGPMEINHPVLLVPPTDHLDDGDLVSNILSTNKQTVLLEGPIPVDSTTKIAMGTYGGLYTIANLRQVIEVLQ